ncbi:C3a anaphylatoxin chemotactic receptor-like [Coregonus clupeaformis]|uniref:C3a anaphylatoxin chemotactic receptor-like n=1 Tax=Coregonus clupeaformis TaxID=59861 RepID=UPI001E1C846A|nr:C3a anaphylatoxin chemotactic receptor-like [Coregonus clupeaformis]
METFTLDTLSTTDYYYDDSIPLPNHSSFGQPSDPSDSSQGGWVILLVVNVVILLLGVFGNGVVIWIAGLKMKKTVNTTWYLSLAISDFIFCACLPFNIISMVTKEWILGLFMCKFTSFVMFLNMFSSIFLLVVISVDRYVLVVFPVWAQNQRTVRRASVVVVLAWAISVVLSIPSTVFRQVTTDGTTKCFNDYPYRNRHIIVAVSRFVSGFVLPLFIIIFCYSVIILRLRTNRMTRSSKPFRVLTALIAMFFISWLPYHVFIILESGASDQTSLTVIHEGLKISATLASANSCMNPFLYSFMGKDFKQKCWNSFLSTIENAFDEEERSSRSRRTSFSQADSKVHTNV